MIDCRSRGNERLRRETFSAFVAEMTLLAGVDDEVQTQLLLSFERLHADGADVRPFRVVRLLVTRQMIFSLEGRVADITNESKNGGS